MVKIADKRRRWVTLNANGCRIGESHPRAKLSDADIDLIFELAEAKLSYAAIAAKFDDIPGGIGKSTVRDVLKGITRSQAIAKRVKR